MARTFGERFLEEFGRAGGSTDGWPSSAVDAMNRADRRAFIAALAKSSSAAARDLTVAAHTAEPEVLARRAAAMARGAGESDWAILVAALAAAGAA